MYYLLNIEIHLYSLAGITISLGLIIDNTIVMVEHIRSRGNRRVFMAILAATLTTAISLSAIFFLDERVKLDLVDFAIIVIINLMVSLASAWFLTPALYERLDPTPNPSPQGSGKNTKIKNKVKIRRKTAFVSKIYTSVISGIRRKQWIPWLFFVLGFGLPVFMLPTKIDDANRFANIYKKTFANSWYIENVKPIVDKILGGSLRLFVQFVYEGSYWNTDRERTTLYVYAYMPPGATIVQMNRSIEVLEQYLTEFKEIDRFETSINNAQNARIYITFKKEHEFGYLPHYLKNELITQSVKSGAAEWSVYGVGDGFSNRLRETTGRYRIQLFGYNYDQLYGYAENIRQQLLENQRIKEVTIMSRNTWEKNKNREFVLTPDIQSLAMNEISLPQYYSMVQNATGNEQYAVSAMIDGTYQNIMYRAKQLTETDRWSLYNNMLNINDAYLKLSSTGEMVKDVEQMDICKEDQQYTLFVSYDYIGSAKMGDRLHERIIKETNEILPLGYRAENTDGGWYWWKKDKKQYWLILLILLVMYLLCAILFESLWKPLAVISIVPFGFIGLFLTFYLFHLNFDQGGFVALVLLCGLTVNAAIYIINDFNNLKHSPCSSNRKYIQALHGKITPVMLTILSTILGLIPFVVGEHRDPFWFALAAGTMGGLLFSLVGILFYLPLFFFRKRVHFYKKSRNKELIALSIRLNYFKTFHYLLSKKRHR
jgi:multidrug efflux pump subunit AcrB